MWWICILSSIFNVLLPLLSTDIGAPRLGHQWVLGILSRAKEKNSCANFWHAPKQEATGKPTRTHWRPNLAHSEDVKGWPMWLRIALKSFFLRNKDSVGVCRTKTMMKERKINKGFQRLEYWDIKRKVETTHSISPQLTYWQQQPMRRGEVRQEAGGFGWRGCWGQPKPTERENLISNDRRAFHLGPCLEMCCV